MWLIFSTVKSKLNILSDRISTEIVYMIRYINRESVICNIIKKQPYVTLLILLILKMCVLWLQDCVKTICKLDLDEI